MTSKEAFEKIMRIYGDTNSLEGTYELFLKIKQDLERLEALEKENKPYLELLTNNAKYQNDNQILQQENQDLWQQIENYNHKFAEVERKKCDLQQKIEKLKKALEKACKILSWDCPCCQDLIDDLDCENRCQPDIDYAECWKKYFLKEVLDE